MNIENYQLPDPTWQWVSKDWMIDMTEDVDEAGWQYALKFHGAVWHGKQTMLQLVYTHANTHTHTHQAITNILDRLCVEEDGSA